MTLDQEARLLAQELLNEYGKNCAIVQTATGAYDPETGQAGGTQYTYALKAYLEAPNRQDFASGLVVQSDEMAIFPALGLPIEPMPGDVFVTSINPIDSLEDVLFGPGSLIGNDLMTVRTIKSVARIWSGEQVALWRVAVSG